MSITEQPRRRRRASDPEVAAAPEVAMSIVPPEFQPVDAPPEMVVPKPLGPGDDDPNDKPRSVALGEPQKPLGPGDEDPRDVSRGEPAKAQAPLGPGDTDPNDKVDRNFEMLAQPAPGPGETFTPRRITVFPNETKE